MDEKLQEITSEVDHKTGEVASEIKEAASEARDLVDEVKETAVDWVVQTMVLALCMGSLVVVLGILLLMVAII